MLSLYYESYFVRAPQTKLVSFWDGVCWYDPPQHHHLMVPHGTSLSQGKGNIKSRILYNVGLSFNTGCTDGLSTF